MANTLAPSSALAACEIDPIQLHTLALNGLSRLMRELRADSIDYDLVQRHLDSATQALGTLRIVDALFAH